MTLPSIEETASLIHAAWVESKLAQGVTSRLSSDGIEQMVPYAQLPDHLKELDRATVRAVYAAIEASTPPWAETIHVSCASYEDPGASS